MMISPRWRKIISDLLSNKGRTLLVILSIAVGVFAVGFVMTSFDILLTDMNTDYLASSPHEAVLYISPVTEDDLAPLRRVAGVAEIEGRSSYMGRVNVSSTQKAMANIIGINKVDEMQIDQIKPNVEGQTIPPLGDREVLLERSVMGVLNLKEGDYLKVEDVTNSNRSRQLKVVGYVHDVNAPPYLFAQMINGYVNRDTVEWLGGSTEYSQLYITVKENKTDDQHVKDIAGDVTDKLKKAGVDIYYTQVYQPGRHWAADITNALSIIMGILGALSVFLSAFLVVNTINSLLAQQIRQIGMMKAIGGQQNQIAIMYLFMVAGFGLMALLLAMPISTLLGYGTAVLIANMLNFNIGIIRVPLPSFIMQVIVAIGVPVGAAIVPVITGTHVTIREAISSYGLNAGQFGKNLLDRTLEKIRFLSRPLLISIRNTFRRKGRMALTLFTLTLAGSIFIAVFNLQGAFDITIQQTLGYFLSDINISFDRYYRISEVYPIVQSLPGVQRVEAWASTGGQILSPDKKTSKQVQFIAPPADSKLISPTLIKGRWITPGDENAIVIGNHLLAVRPDLKVGDVVIIKINDKEYEWEIVGQYQMAGNTDTPILYANYDYLTRLTNQLGKTSNVRVEISPNDATTQENARTTYEKALKDSGINVTDITTGAQVEASNAATTNVLVYFLLVMSVLIAMVGGLGLSGTMSMNIIERTREIGVMRAIGATDRDIAALVLVESLLIGVISWILGIILALPISYLLDVAVGLAFIQSPLQFVFSANGCIIWLVGMLIIAAVASLLPARNASRLTIREVLAYE
ncbi:MAG: FtsX-like permease family protein [Anaerolineae bacterium]|nr:FtsX-like permease family protein [Anaerolineae bacterium]